MTIYSTHYSSPLGNLKIQCSDVNIEAVLFSKEDERQEGYDHQLLQTCVGQLDEYFAGKEKHLIFPCNKGARPFNKKFGTCFYKFLMAKP